MSTKISLRLPKEFGDAVKSLAPGQVYEFTAEDGAHYAILKYEEFARLAASAGVVVKGVLPA